jgi:hypothetical protein
MIGEYHEQQLRLLLDHVRDGFARMDGGEIDPFDLDELIHHYKRSAQKLWSFLWLERWLVGAGGADARTGVRTGRAGDGLVGGRPSAQAR